MPYNVCSYMSDAEVVDLLCRISFNLREAMRMYNKLPSEICERLPDSIEENLNAAKLIEQLILEVPK